MDFIWGYKKPQFQTQAYRALSRGGFDFPLLRYDGGGDDDAVILSSLVQMLNPPYDEGGHN